MTALIPRRPLLFALILLLGVGLFVPYANSFYSEWFYDDFSNIVDNENIHLKTLNFSELKRATYGRTYGIVDRPVAFLSFALNYYFSKDKVFSYHVVNWVLHCCNAWLLFFLILRTLSAPRLPELSPAKRCGIAFLAVLLWGTSPVHVTVVSSVVQRMTLLAVFFYLAGALCYIDMRLSPKKVGVGVKVGIILFFWICGVASKEIALTLPVFILLWELSFVAQYKKQSLKKILKWVFWGTLLMSIPLLFFLYHHQFPILENYAKKPFSLSMRLLTEPRVFWFYLSLLIWPHPARLNFIHDFELSRGWLDPWTTTLAVVCLMAYVGWNVRLLRKYPLVSFSLLLFFVNHVMEGSFIALDILMEYRNYLPSIFLFVPVSYLVFNSHGTLLPKSGLKRIAVTVLVAGVCLCSMGATFLRNQTFQNPERIWSDNIYKAPELWMPRQNMAWRYYQQGKYKEAIAHSSLALEGRSDEEGNPKAFSWFCIAMSYRALNQTEKELNSFEHAIQNLWYFPDIFHEYGKTLGSLGQYSRAEELVRTALNAKPYSSEYYGTLVVLLMLQEDWEGALKDIDHVLGWTSWHAFFTETQGECHRALGEYAAAEICFQKIVDGDRDSPFGYLALMELYYMQSREEPLEQIRKQFLEKFSGADWELLKSDFQLKHNRSGDKRLHNLEIIMSGNDNSSSKGL